MQLGAKFYFWVVIGVLLATYYVVRNAPPNNPAPKPIGCVSPNKQYWITVSQGPKPATIPA